MARRTALWLTLALLVLALAGCSDSKNQSTAANAAQCPDLTGSWHSETFDTLSVGADGSDKENTGLTMTLEVTDQKGCHFSATNTWSNGEIGGTEYAAGVLNPDGGWITVLEAGMHPVGGSTGRALGRLLQDDQMTWEYAAYSNDGQRAEVYSTILARQGTPLAREDCPDMTGTWTGYPFDVLNVYADGTTDQQTQTSNVLEVVNQVGCAFRGTNTWHKGDLGGSEHVAGVLHSDGVLVTILEVGPHPEEGTRAFIQGRLRDDHTLEWDYAGISDDTQKGQGFTTKLVNQGEPGPRQDCPDLKGKWSTDGWDGFRAHADGTHEPVTSDFHNFEIKVQIGCTIMATSTYAPLDEGGDEWTENWVGVINGEEGLLIMRTLAAPSDRLASLLFGRIVSANEFDAEYSGYSADGSSVLVYLQHLTRE